MTSSSHDSNTMPPPNPQTYDQRVQHLTQKTLAEQTLTSSPNEPPIPASFPSTAIKLGRGACGTVYTLPSSASSNYHPTAYKSEDGHRPPGNLRHDHTVAASLHSIPEVLLTAASPTHVEKPNASDGSIALTIRIPRPQKFFSLPISAIIPPDQRSRPSDTGTVEIFQMERIPPIPLWLQEAYLDLYFPAPCPTSSSSSSSSSSPNNHQATAHSIPAARKSVLARGAHESCLLRVYLGKDRLPATTGRFMSLFNAPLHCDQLVQHPNFLQDQRLTPRKIAEEMGKVLGILHGGVQVDGNDVEFVVGGTGFPSPSVEGGGKGGVALYLLDFDCTRPLDWTREWMQQACEAYWVNDAYFPRPPPYPSSSSSSTGAFTGEKRGLWQRFRSAYLETSLVILRRRFSAPTGEGSDYVERREGEDYEAMRELPGLFLELVEGESERREVERRRKREDVVVGEGEENGAG